ncbi:hypothetical protein GO491_04960 [Flavobacteriaceae bacterium Ap0902]|nr:hypothetical protein [Flavobacteriaceae bacterium Ap0902]
MKPIYLVLLCFIFTNCYVYQVNNFEKAETIPPIEKQIKKDQLYKLKVNNEIYKVQAAAWEGDSLVTYINFKEDKVRKFHKNDITEVQQRTFARGRSDALTFGIYGGIAAIIILLSK